MFFWQVQAHDGLKKVDDRVLQFNSLMEDISLINVLENTRNRVLELTAQIKPLPLMPVSNGKQTNTHTKTHTT